MATSSERDYISRWFAFVAHQGWAVASSAISDSTYVVRNLQPGTTYTFLVRSQNSHGLSLPSPVTAAVKTRGMTFRKEDCFVIYLSHGSVLLRSPRKFIESTDSAVFIFCFCYHGYWQTLLRNTSFQFTRIGSVRPDNEMVK